MKSLAFTAKYKYNENDKVAKADNANNQYTANSYDAFGSEKNPTSYANPFRYCGEYWDSETSTYYLRARYYDPSLGRFTQEDTHWNTANRIYGDNPQKINEREDKLGLKYYSYIPQLSAVVQAGNLYVYGLGNPIYYIDHSGESAAEAWASTMWWLPFVDTYLPFGDIFYGLGIVATGLYDAVNEVGIDNVIQILVNAKDVVADSADKVSNFINNLGNSGSTGNSNNNWNHRDYYLNQAENQKLRNVIDQLYRPGASVGDGGTADMLRNEFDSGQTLRHLQKAQDYITSLNNILETQHLSDVEIKLVYKLLNDLYDAVKYVGG